MADRPTRRDLLSYFAAGTVITPAVQVFGQPKVEAKLVEVPRLVELATEIPKAAPVDLEQVTGFTLYLDTPQGTRKIRGKSPIVTVKPAVPMHGGDQVSVALRFTIYAADTSPRVSASAGILHGNGVLI